MTPPVQVLELIERFERYLDLYKQPGYKEARVRVEFIDPFFEALGWDVHNRQGRGEHDKDVVYEDAIKVGGKTRAPDYSFRIGQERKFFLEAKKPAVSLIGDVGPAYQLRRYSWSVKLPLGVLTDFEEFAVYDCRQRPRPTDKPTVGRIMYVTFDQYRDRFDEIYGVFAKESVQQGSFDRYAQETKTRRGTSEVDAELLKEIEGWREKLARNIALRNGALSVHELNFCVQRTIDRIIFLRMCEDRGIEEYGQLLALTNGPHIYPRLGEYYRRADVKYNAGLFDFQADTLTKTLTIDDQVLKPILTSLYYPQCPYEFSVLPVEILGQVYEQFLGKVIRLTPSHRAKVEEKPEVKKAGGVYYTPSYIVDYIVQQTVGQLIEGKTPRQINKLRILDPACGSGSFLLGAYQYLLDYHRQWYEEHDPVKHARRKQPAVYQAPSPPPLSPPQLWGGSTPPLGPPQPFDLAQDKLWGGSRGGEWRLTGAEKKRILLNNIHGVDIDRQAVEVTKLSLLLKVLEGETEETLGQQLAFWRERALPDLGNNIKCGNSLIGPDYFTAQLLPDEGEMRRVNPFDWESEFPEVMAAGGFDCVIGNPPWISLTGKFGARIYPKSDIEYLIRKFAGNTYMPNMYEYFVAQGLNLLTAGGYFGYIVPDRLGFNSQFVELRRRILDQTQIISLIYRTPFPGITADTLMFVLHRAKSIDPKSSVEIGEYGHELLQIPQLEFEQDPTYSFQYYDSVGAMRLVRKLECSTDLAPLNSICDSTSGFGGKSKLITRTRVSPTQIETIKGNSIDRYTFKKGYWFDFRKENITGRTTDKTKLGARPKILLRKTGDRILATLDDSGIFPEQSLYFLFNNQSALDFRYLLGILNSALATFYYRNRLITNRRSIAQLKKVHLDAIPIRTINFDDPTDAARHDKMVALVERMLALHHELAAATVPTDKQLYQRQIEAIDRQIDALVYELYGLTEEEIEIVEDATG